MPSLHQLGQFTFFEIRRHTARDNSPTAGAGTCAKGTGLGSASRSTAMVAGPLTQRSPPFGEF
eukprot:2606416-Heterocapsa_arctica.AAC.1